MQKASLVKGTRDFGPIEVAKRNFIFDIIKKVFQSYGFAPLETPSMETLETLGGKYGDEGDQLLFRILNNGDIVSKAAENLADNKVFKNSISDKGLRYDLTVPFARYTAMNRHSIKMPFKRYQIQPVWRADRPQKGRYREFWQCDADTIGTDSLLCEVECIEIFDKVFAELKLPVIIHINHRKLLEAIAHELGFAENFIDFTVAIDKLDKIGFEGVVKELKAKTLDTALLESQAHLLKPLPFNKSNCTQLLADFKSSMAKTALVELSEILNLLDSPSNQIILDPSLARGLSYYTGTIFEVKLEQQAYGSVAAGGRYDDLTEVFGVKDVSGIGISFGADRIYDVLEDLDLFPTNVIRLADMVICPMDKTTVNYALGIAKQVRTNTDLSVIVYPNPGKLKKQLDYANALSARFAIVLGTNEMESNTCTLKNLTTGEQTQVSIHDITTYLP